MQSLMVMGTTSDSGKSTIVAALCRWLHRQGISVAPFKPQNMALNSAVTEDGGEIGRSTALQALACGIEPHSDMNPVLLKPQTDRGAQVILRGQVYGNMDAVDYHGFKKEARKSVMAAWEALKARYDVIIVEGAGSPAEVNLRENDIANMGFAEAADLPVLLVGDIDRGGVFAQLVGTLQLLSQSERDRVTGLLINRFRGDPALLEDGLKWLEDYTGKPVVGVFPYLQGLILDAEDSVGLTGTEADEDALKVVVPALPRMSNHNDFDPLRLHPKVDLQFIGPDQPKPGADLIILPGSKSTRADREWLKAQGWDDHIQRHLRYGGKVLGICGGFQMLGRTIADPDGIEGEPGETEGLNLLDLETRLVEGKQLRRVTGVFADSGTPMSGYEIHNGVTTGSALERPLVSLDGRLDGAVSQGQDIAGCYIHGAFDGAQACNALLIWAGLKNDSTATDYQQHRQVELDRLVEAVDEHLKAEFLLQE